MRYRGTLQVEQMTAEHLEFWDGLLDTFSGLSSGKRKALPMVVHWCFASRKKHSIGPDTRESVTGTMRNRIRITLQKRT